MNNLPWLPYGRPDKFIQLFLFEPLYTMYSWNSQKHKQTAQFWMEKKYTLQDSIFTSKEKHICKCPSCCYFYKPQALIKYNIV